MARHGTFISTCDACGVTEPVHSPAGWARADQWSTVEPFGALVLKQSDYCNPCWKRIIQFAATIKPVPETDVSRLA